MATLNTTAETGGYVDIGTSAKDKYTDITYTSSAAWTTKATDYIRLCSESEVDVWHVKNVATGDEFYLFYDADLEIKAKYQVLTIRHKIYTIEILSKTKLTEREAFSQRVDEILHKQKIAASPRPDSGIKKVIFNEDKGTTCVLWKDGTKTVITCDKWDGFDKEKAIALCYMKKAHDNRGCFNETLKEWIPDLY